MLDFVLILLYAQYVNVSLPLPLSECMCVCVCGAGVASNAIQLWYLIGMVHLLLLTGARLSLATPTDSRHKNHYEMESSLVSVV